MNGKLGMKRLASLAVLGWEVAWMQILLKMKLATLVALQTLIHRRTQCHPHSTITVFSHIRLKITPTVIVLMSRLMGPASSRLDKSQECSKGQKW